MNRSTIIIVAFGFVFALLAAMAVQFIGGGKKNQSTDEAAKTITVLVAARDIKAGETLGSGSMQWTTWPETSKSTDAILREGTQKPDDALKGRVKRPFAKGEPLTKAAVIEDAKGNFVAGALGAGKRAVTLTVTAQSSVAGFVSAGDRVDVILTYDVRIPTDEKLRRAAMTLVSRTASETILEDIKILAVDQDTAKRSDAKVGKTITIEVSPQQAEIAALAPKMGTLSLALRPLGDDTENKAPGPITTDIRVSGVLQELLKGENKTGSSSQVVRVYSGSRVDNVEVRPYVTQ